MRRKNTCSRGGVKPVQPPTTFEETVERWQPHSSRAARARHRLPPERDLADQLRISRSTLRQALTTLVQSGHLISVRGRAGGTFVADEPPLGQAAEGEVLTEDARAVLDYRVAVETGATVLAAERASEDDLERRIELTGHMTRRPVRDYRRADCFPPGVARRVTSPADNRMPEAGPDEPSHPSDRPPPEG